MDSPLSVVVYPDAESAKAGAAEEIASVLRSAASVRGQATIALAGGRTPEGCYRKLAQRHDFAECWDRVKVFWGDERCVSTDAPSSNYRMAKRSLIDEMTGSPAGIYPMLPFEARQRGDFERAAERYAETLRDEITERVNGIPSLDLAILGIGVDGHTASLFPGDPLIGHDKQWVRLVEAPQEYSPRHRLTLTLPLLSSARVVCFLVTGREKRDVVAEVLRCIRSRSTGTYTKQAAPRYPAAGVFARERLIFVLDAACS